MFVVDSNILIYATNSRDPLHAKCNELLFNWQRQPGLAYLTWGICYEYLRVSTHPRVYSSPLPVSQAFSFLESLLGSPGFSLLLPGSRHGAVLSQVLSEVPLLEGNIMHDTETAVLMREHGIRRICTRDVDFHRFPFLEVLDPTRL